MAPRLSAQWAPLRDGGLNRAEKQVLTREIVPEVEIVPGECPQPDYVVDNSANNQLGSVVYAATQLQPTEPVSGTCRMAHFILEIKDTHAVPLSFESIILSDRFGAAIPVGAQGTTITVSGELFYNVYIPLVQG